MLCVIPRRGFLIQKSGEQPKTPKIMKLGEYINATKAEMTHVNWPTKQQTTRFTVAVILVSLGVAVLLGICDFVFSRLLTLLF